MLATALNQRSQLLEAAADVLDIPPRLYEEAVLKYEDIGAWLADDESELSSYSPEIYPQGSFRLGTMVRPHGMNGDYDIDLVCLLQIDKDAVSKSDLKKKVGDRLKKRSDLKEVLTECHRAWTLDFPPQFHMDVLSTIPNSERRPTGILLPDKDLHVWQKSNPIAYADWFYDRMKVVFQQKRAALAEELRASIEEVPYWQVKTPLQRVVQILKRHRDIHFEHDLENRPVSIIITTLAAHAYQNQADIYAALIDVVKAMPNFIEKRGDKWWVANPVEPDENFAERWNECPQRREAFFDWMAKAYSDFVSAAQQSDIGKIVAYLSPALGRTTMTKAAASIGVGFPTQTSVALPADDVPALSDARHCLPPQWPLAIAHKASIFGTVHRDLFQSKKLWDLTTRSVPKGVGLRFQVKTNVPPPYDVRWQVVNTGREALMADQLRGDFEDDNSSIPGVRWEGTAYAGTHWVEAFVIKGGICVARTGQKRVRVRG
jgi:hypothetical protein